MQEDYRETDLHMAFAARAHLAPAGATKDSHPAIRKIAKPCVLGGLFGQTAYGLAKKLGIQKEEAQGYIDARVRGWSVSEVWGDALLEYAHRQGEISTAGGWVLYGINDKTRPGKILNHPIQGTAADILRRLVRQLARDRVRILALNHDEILVECRDDDAIAVEALCKRRMVEAGQALLGGLELGVKSAIVRYPDHYPLDQEDEIFLASVLEEVEKVEEIDRVVKEEPLCNQTNLQYGGIYTNKE